MAPDGRQYAEVLVSGKTKQRTLPLIMSIPYMKEWIQDHPFTANTNSYLFVLLAPKNFGDREKIDGTAGSQIYQIGKLSDGVSDMKEGGGAKFSILSER